MTEASVRVERANGVLWRRTGTEILAALPDESEIRRLGGSAAAVWVLLDAPRTVDELVGELGAAYDVPPEDIVDPVTGCVDELASLGLVDSVRQADG